MDKIYLDNAATTRPDPQVIEEMLPYYEKFWGNPSSIHGHGREVRVAIEKARRKVADYLNTSPSEIFFTSGGTEADNTALRMSIQSLGVKHLITSRLEHHAVLHTAEALHKEEVVNLSFVNNDKRGNIDLAHLEELLRDNPNALVSLMHGNNEIGTLLEIDEVTALCEEYGAIFHSDTVQTVSHFHIDLDQLPIHFLAASAHKFHGPKGVGFMYMKSDHIVKPLLIGGGQERNMRGGTENVPGIIGLAKAMELAYDNLAKDRKNIETLKIQAIELINQKLPGAYFNGESSNLHKSLYTVLNIGIPAAEDNDMLLFNMDINGVSLSGGSACTSGSSIGSHVLEAIGAPENDGAIRMSFSKFNTAQEIEFAVGKLADLVGSEAKIQ